MRYINQNIREMIGTRNVTANDQDGGINKICATVVHVTSDYHRVSECKNANCVHDMFQQVYTFLKNTRHVN